MTWLAPHDRPREKLERLGPSGLGDNELLAIIVGHGFRSASAIDLSNQILASARGVHGLTRQSLADLRRLKGLGVAKASQILAAVELGRRTLSQKSDLPVRRWFAPRGGVVPSARSWCASGRAIWHPSA